MKCMTCGSEMAFMTSDLYCCNECMLISSSLKPDSTIYLQDYMSKYKHYENTDIGKNILKVRMDMVLGNVDKKDRKKILDFGCATGVFIDECRQYFDKCIGFDINPYSKRFNYIENLFDDFSVCTFWDSLEHIKNPKKVLVGLDPKYVFICTPSTDDIELENILSWRHYRPREHIHLFNEHSLTKFLDECGYKIKDVNYEESSVRRGGKDKNLITVCGVKK